jgi:hypothetical protein
MEEQVERFSKARQEFITLLQKFPEDKRESVLFDQWSLKDVLVHIVGWDQCYLDGLRALQRGEKGVWRGNVDEHNEKTVTAGKHLTYGQAYATFLATSQRVIDESHTLPHNLWTAELYEGRKYTPERFLRTITKHYEEEHIPELRKYV